MVKVLITDHARQQITAIYQDYDLAYVGSRFSDAFRQWNTLFYKNMSPIFRGQYTKTLPNGQLQYAYRECTITYTRHNIDGTDIFVIQDYIFNQDVLNKVREGTRIERKRHGIGKSRRRQTPSSKNPQDYTSYQGGGTFGGNRVVIVKRKRISAKATNKPLLNYMLYPQGGSPYIMYGQDFLSADPFVGDIAKAWGTDGRRYLLSSEGHMEVIEESQTILCDILTETIMRYLKNWLLSYAK